MGRHRRRRFLGCMVAIVIVIVVISGLILGAYFGIKEKYGIDLISTYKQISALTEEVNEEELCDNKYSEEDKESVMENANNVCPGLITKDEDGYHVNLDEDITLSSTLLFTDKEVAAAIAIVMEEESKKSEEGKEFELKQISFDNIQASGSSDVKVIVKMDLKSLKASIPSGVSFLANSIPDALYISTTISITKLDEYFDYTYSSQGFSVNNLNESDTKELLATIEKIIPSFGSAEDLSSQIDDMLIQGIIGDEENPGFVYSLKDKGAKGFNFKEIDNKSYIEIGV